MKIEINNCKKSNFSSGFTLVELSIVIVIIAMLTAGVFGGQHLVQQAKLRNVMKEIKENDTAIHAFKDKFKYFPGDLPNANSYWGSATNGDGDWQIAYDSEGRQAWLQLNLAGFMPGSYTGTDAGTPDHQAGVNVPATALNPTGFYALQYFNGSIFLTTGNAMQLATADSTVGVWGKILTAQDARKIDIKIDDGKPAMGNLYASVANDGTASTCASETHTFTGDPATVTYVVSSTVVTCRYFWWLDKDR